MEALFLATDHLNILSREFREVRKNVLGFSWHTKTSVISRHKNKTGFLNRKVLNGTLTNVCGHKNKINQEMEQPSF